MYTHAWMYIHIEFSHSTYIFILRYADDVWVYQKKHVLEMLFPIK